MSAGILARICAEREQRKRAARALGNNIFDTAEWAFAPQLLLWIS
jgi:hypothetical protein